jgi:hypothetical protein
VKIINRKQFLALPEGVLFSKYKPYSFEPPLVKGESMPNDFGYQDIVYAVKCGGSDDMMNILEESELTGSSFDMDFDCGSRDGLFEDAQLFVVWEKKDLDMLKALLSQCVPA